MIYLCLFCLIYIYELITHKIRGRYLFFYTCLAFLLAYTIFCYSICFFIILLSVYIFNHYHFLLEEKLFAGMLIFNACIIIFLFWQTNNQFLAIITFLMFSLFEYIAERIMKREENKTIIYQNKLMKQQITEIENIYLTMRGWRHDYHNHLQSLKSYLKLGQIDNMQKYLNELEVDLDQIDTLYHSGNLQLDSILNAKLAIAQKDDIKINCDADIPPKLSISDIDLCVLVGNLLDNAIESCRKIEKKEERFIRIYISNLKRQLYICITNATKETVKQRTDTYFSNKRGDHGHGLKRVDRIIEKYDGYLNRQNEPGVFASEIILPL